MNKVIFLDFDGVLNDNFSNNFSSESVNVLKNIINLNEASLVIISSYLGNGTKVRKKKIINLLNEYDLGNIDFIDPNFKGYFLDISIPSRVVGIVDYLLNNPECSYIILDDEYFNDYKLLALNYYRVDGKKGLKERDLKCIKFKEVNTNILNKVSYSYRKLGDYEQATNNLSMALKKILKMKINNN